MTDSLSVKRRISISGAMAAKENCNTGDISVKELQDTLVKNGAIIMDSRVDPLNRKAYTIFK